MKSDAPDKCDSKAVMYIQAPCIIPQHQMTERLIKGLMIACLTLGIVFFIIHYIEYLKVKSDFEYIDWDFKVLSAADYTMEFEINKKMWTNFLSTYYDVSNPISEI